MAKKERSKYVKKKPDSSIPWDLASIEYMKDNFALIKISEMAGWLTVYFGKKVTLNQVRAQAQKMGIKKNKRQGDEWVL